MDPKHSEIFFIGLFQLKNLLEQRVGFLFFWVGNEKPSNHDSLSTAIALDPPSIRNHLQENGVPKDAPIVLACQKGEASLQVATQLTEEGFVNICVLREGWQNQLKNSLS